MLRSGRGAHALGETRALRRSSAAAELCVERIEMGLLEVGRRLDAVMRILSPYRASDDELHEAYVAAHDAMGDLAATYAWVTLGSQQARPAPPARRRRPWGG